jgi:predicted metal-dependent phosphoesterase TrpH
MKSKANLHIHTKYSDGGKTVPEVISALKDAGLEYFAITDHDTVEGNFEAVEYAKKYNMKHFNGIEMTCQFSHGEIGLDESCSCHILGLGLDAEKMQKRLKIVWESKNIKARKLHELLVAGGYNLEPIYENPTHNYIRNELIAKGYAKDKGDCNATILFKDTYRQYAFVNIDVQAAIQTIKECGGLAIWAHPFKVSRFGQRKELNNKEITDLLDLLCVYGLDGIEAYYQHHSDCSPEQIKFFESLANSKRLLKSIGTDYHHKKISDQIFFDVEGITPDETIIDYLEIRKENKHVPL